MPELGHGLANGVDLGASHGKAYTLGLVRDPVR